MQTEQIVALLIAERDLLSRAIEALQGGVTRRAQTPPASAPRTPTPSGPAANGAPKKRRISAAGRKRIAEAARRRWAAVKAAKASPSKKS